MTNNPKPLTGHLMSPLMRYASGRRLIRFGANRWTRGKDMTMQVGIGAGLRFNAAQSNPMYAIGANEWPIQTWLAENVHADDVVYDVGANVGFFTLLAARLVGSGGHVYAFEPVPDNVAAIRHNLDLNQMSQVTVLQQAVTDEVGEGTLLLSHYSGGASLSTAGAPPDLKGELVVPLTTLDDLVTQQAYPPPALVKIDVEGAEIQVLRGMTRLLQTVQPVLLYEIDDGDSIAYEQKRDECAAFLVRQGYGVLELEDAYPDIKWYVGHFVARPAAIG